MTCTLWIYGIIGEAPPKAADKHYSFQDFQKEFDPNADDYVVHIFSPGGDVFQGFAMYNALKNTGKSITVQINGVCASIATLIAGAASPGKLLINEQSQYLVHNPRFNNISGDANELRAGADQLDQIKTLLINVYRKRTGLSEEALWEVLNAQKTMTASQAQQLGFVDEVMESMRAVAFADMKFLKYMEQNTILQAIENLGKQIEKIWKPKNEIKAPVNMTVTTKDNVVLQVMSEDGEWVGKQVSTEDGQPLAAGEYPLSDGSVLVVGENSTIAEVRTAEAQQTEEPEDMKAKEELEKAQARIKELESALEARNTAVVETENKVKTLENKINIDIKALTEELTKIKNTTAGDQSLPDLGEKKQFNDGKQHVADPMQEWFKQKFGDRIQKD